ncbi:MAG TPA: electron transfer flavoprotein beta subunit/FixA family protein [Actinobacteria bacterium]|nr:electron transfer flavoprotein beta subunit/FixA family protein [Actinomycetes bacterium]HEX21234.1 electron transfer flavoprotein beta subunit/FixA family protein [Actinomycetota bacterium]
MIVCIKQVPDTTQVRIDPKTNTLIRQGIPTIVNPYDLHALEAAVELKENHGGFITALTMGPPQAKEALKEAISAGCDGGVLLTDRAFAGSDTLATSYILSAAIRRLDADNKVDLIICGQQSIDGDTAQVGPGIAQRLNYSQLTYVSKIREMDIELGNVIVERRLENGTQVVSGRLPALITVVKEINEYRYASLANLIKAAKFEPIIWNQEYLKLDKSRIGLKGSPTTVRRIFAPPRKSSGEIVNYKSENSREIMKSIIDIISKVRQ